MSQFVRKSDPILDLGCGNSVLSVSLFRGGYKKIMSVDFAKTCIDQHLEYRKSRRDLWGLQYMVMDARDLSFEDNKFSAVIDKGTSDAVDCGSCVCHHRPHTLSR